MPDSWSDGDGDDADDPDLPLDDDAAAGRPMHPDDRLWRHPSELAWIAPSSAAASLPAPTEPGPRPARVWSLALTSGLTGAALALGMVALIGGLATGGEDGTAVDRFAPTGTAATTPTGLAAVAEAILPSVVRVEAADGTGGTGVVLLDDGHVLTSAHVVAGADEVRLIVADGTSVPAQVIGVDDVTELAVVAPLEGHEGDAAWVPATIGDDDGVDVGEAVVAVGAPYGVRGAPSLSVGVVAAVGRRVGSTRGIALRDMIETDAPVADGAAGGALCDRTGAVVGLTAMADGSGSGYATPIEAAWAVAEALIEEGVVHHVWLGIEGSDLASPSGATVAGLTSAVGVRVERVVAGSPAEAGGLLAGDQLVAVDDHAVASMDDLVVALRAYEPGDEVEVHVERDGDEVVALVTLAER